MAPATEPAPINSTPELDDPVAEEPELDAGGPVVEIPEPVQSAAHARLGSEGLSRLRARHAEVLARIDDQVPDPARREELKTLADRLNPDTWVTDAEVTAGIEGYEGVFESLRGVIGRRRRRRGRPDEERGPDEERPADTGPMAEANGTDQQASLPDDNPDDGS